MGDGAVGKTSMIKQFNDQEFVDEHITTLGLDFVVKKYKTKDGRDFTVKIWDTAGQERFKTLTYSFYKKADGVIIAYDITEQRSFENVTTWIDSITQHAGDNVAKILVGNKVDLEENRAVKKENAELLALNNNLHYYETSARNNMNIKECMEDIFEQSI